MTNPPLSDHPAAGDGSSPRQLRRAWLTIAVATSVFLVLAILPGDQLGLAPWLTVASHNLLETMSIVVSVLLFSIGWHTFSRERSSSVALLCTVFFAVAILDFVHLLTFQGMPPLNTPGGAGKAIPFFLAARLLVAVALLAIALLPWERRASPAVRFWLSTGCLAFALAISWWGLATPDLQELMFIRGVGLTSLKIGLEYVIIALNLAAAVLFYRRARQPQPFPVAALFAAAYLAALSELCFTLYTATTDESNFLGHVFKVWAYLLVYRALFVKLVSLPYSRLQQARDEILRLNATLEQRVRDRTEQFEAANRELERFSWSVAHDLRSPLSVIGNYSAVIAKGGGKWMTEGDWQAISRIQANVSWMKDMIEALLELANVSRAQLQLEQLDLAQIAADVARSLRESDGERKVDLDIQGPMPVVADRRMLTIALDNLIGNAWKFTSGKPDARITIGRDRQDGEAVFFVRDNGVGFDMAESPKLFGAFQRLQTSTNFEGHGIGLANVRRIVARHGGRIWAESEPGHGATFYFTLQGGQPEARPLAA